MLVVNQDAGNARQVGQRPHMPIRGAIDDINAVSAGMRDIEPYRACRVVIHIRMVKAWTLTCGNGNKTSVNKCHTASLSFAHGTQPHRRAVSERLHDAEHRLSIDIFERK